MHTNNTSVCNMLLYLAAHMLRTAPFLCDLFYIFIVTIYTSLLYIHFFLIFLLQTSLPSIYLQQSMVSSSCFKNLFMQEAHSVIEQPHIVCHLNFNICVAVWTRIGFLTFLFPFQFHLFYLFLMQGA